MRKLLLLFALLWIVPIMAQDPPKVLMYIEGTQITLTAIPDEGWVFGHWSGDIEGKQNPVTFTIESDMEVVAHFFRVYTLEIRVEGGGSVGHAPDSYNGSD